MVLFLLHNTLGAWWAGKVLASNASLATSAPDEAALRAACKVGDIDWEHVFGTMGVRWFHTGGIFAALSATTVQRMVSGRWWGGCLFAGLLSGSPCGHLGRNQMSSRRHGTGMEGGEGRLPTCAIPSLSAPRVPPRLAPIYATRSAAPSTVYRHVSSPCMRESQHLLLL